MGSSIGSTGSNSRTPNHNTKRATHSIVNGIVNVQVNASTGPVSPVAVAEEAEVVRAEVVSDTESENTIVSHPERAEITTQYSSLSEPPPRRSQRRCGERFDVQSAWYGRQMGGRLMGMRFPDMSCITHKVTDEKLSCGERIEWLKSMKKYLTNCKNTMTAMCGQISSEGQKVILCVDGIISDLERHRIHREREQAVES